MTLPNRTIDVITGELHVALRRETADILTIGGLLAEARDQLPHGEWLPWLKSEFSMSERSAQKYVKAADYAAKYELGADLKLSPSALFLISRYDQREIADAVINAAKETHLGCDQAKEIIGKKLAELGGAQQDARRRRAVNPGDYLLLRFTAAITGLDCITKNKEAERFTKSRLDADTFARLGRLLTDIAKAKQAPPETDVDRAA